MRAYLAHKWIPFHRHGGDWYGRLGWSDDELDQRMREFYSGHVRAVRRGARASARWGDKTPWHAWHLRELGRVVPGRRVHRDGAPPRRGRDLGVGAVPADLGRRCDALGQHDDRAGAARHRAR